MSGSNQRLAYMADQIARNFAVLGEDAAIAATANHIANFWDPRMREQAQELRRTDPAAFSAPALAALARLLPAANA